jgi:UDP-N-acetylglucosamine--N-acetylmuramyl-(pentapeptide) pyrophosphoryl-undecaprenol N-acetylglucosamine transferase
MPDAQPHEQPNAQPSAFRVVLAAGGTAGHIEPALNLADALRRIDPATSILVIGGERGLEGSLVPARGYHLEAVESAPMPRRLSRDLARVIPGAWRATRQAERLLDGFGAEVVVGFGGYAALPTYLAARRRRVPLVVHEANARPGLANRVGARLTPHVFSSVPGTLRGASVIGLPLRQAISHLDRLALRSQARESFGLRADAPVLLVFGGSQGAAHLNESVAGAIAELTAGGFQVLHAYGARNPQPTAHAGYVRLPYLDRMDLAYAAADLALTRAGAMTCAELAAVGLPAVYVPLPIGNGEQRLNAQPVVSAGGGLIVDDADLSAAALLTTLAPLLSDQDRLASMATAAAAHGVRDADEQLARTVMGIASARRA